jgi:DNA-binding transcriptional LysR family regulator
MASVISINKEARARWRRQGRCIHAHMVGRLRDAVNTHNISTLMQKCITPETLMDWDNARIFLAIYRKGTLRSAAALLDIDQATVGRRLNALETSLGARLFLRTPSGYMATPAGELAVHAAEKMEHAALQFQREMQGIDNRLSGVVRVTTSDTMAAHFVIAPCSGCTSSIRISASCSTGTEITSLTRREADLAVRTLKPTSPDLISRHLTKAQHGPLRHAGLSQGARHAGTGQRPGGT